MTEIKVPALGESVTEATIGQWFKKEGEAVKADEPVVELETDKVTVEVPAPAAGVLQKIAVQPGETVNVGAVLGAIADGAAASTAAAAEVPKPAAAPQPSQSPREKPAAAAAAAAPPLSPAVRKIAEERRIDVSSLAGTGKDGRLTKGDLLDVADRASKVQAKAQPAPAPAPTLAPAPPPAPMRELRAPTPPADQAREERVRMSRLRATIARRLKDAQNTAAMLTTFNEVDMTEVMTLRTAFKDVFEKKHGVKLGFMGFFVKACVQALRDVPTVNAEIDGDDIVYRNYYNIGVAVGTDRGLVVPVVRDADRLTFAEVERTIADFGRKARDGQLKIEDMQGGTFTISNGGVYGSLMSTPILNAPQSGILGMHKIQERPVIVNGAIVARPMMYLALSYDHRLVDGKDAVTFLVRVKECIEDPQRMMLDL
ncbi:MAG TPA: 2-oxoglutarate dehydrogenase complex dihydrolipoyllysine-residue succinyltransferase [Aestuariivirgaceae bacterium]|nr:2-oxoglutarate dehydrogenase complex dihydrolipoyllysine-residue succinyltransferase [Aestuariivirgaceae bacterium]